MQDLDRKQSEADLLLHCARVRLDDCHASQLQEICKHDLDWNLIMVAATAHGLLPLLYWNLKTYCQSLVPESQMQDLFLSYMSHAAASLARATELRVLAERFRISGLTCIPFKGSVVAANYYGDVTLRPSMDLDLLVPREEVQEAISLLRRHGYSPCPWRNKILEERFFQSRQFTRFCHEYTFGRKEDDILVDLHWQLMPNELLPLLPLSWQDLLPHVKQGHFQGVPISFFDEELSLMLHCTHATKHGWFRINWLVDIAQMLDQMKDIDWHSFLATARGLGIEQMILLGVYLTRALPHPHSIDELDQAIAGNQTIARAGDEIIERFRRDPLALEWKELKKWQFWLSLQRGWLEKTSLLQALLTRPTIDERLQITLPDALYPVYSALRATNLGIQHVPRIAARFLAGGYDHNLNPKPFDRVST